MEVDHDHRLHFQYRLAAMVLLVLSGLVNMLTFEIPIAGAEWYLLGAILAVVICILTLLHKWRFLKALILIDVFILLAATVYSYVASPKLLYM